MYTLQSFHAAHIGDLFHEVLKIFKKQTLPGKLNMDQRTNKMKSGCNDRQTYTPYNHNLLLIVLEKDKHINKTLSNEP